MNEKPNPAIDAVLAGGGELGARMRELDWAATSLGAVDTWPQSLRSVVSMLLPSKAQIILFWGPEFVVLYNDAYRPVFGAKHPHVLGQPGREAWDEIWETQLHDLLAGVVRTGEAFWAQDLLFLIERHGFVEETYFDVSYDPVRVESGGVGGVYCIVTETTARVVGARRMALLRELAARQTTARTTDDAYALAMETLAAHPQDITFALAYRGDELQDCTPGAEALRAGTPAHLLRDLAVLPAGAASRGDRLLVGLNARRPFDDQYRVFLELVAGQLGTALANARAYEEARQRAEALAEIDRAKTAFFSNVSHEFRTPLTLILGPVDDLLAGNAIAAEARDRLELVHRNSVRLLKLVNTLLDFSRIEAGRMQAVYQPTDLAALTADLASAFRSAIERAGMRLVVDCPALGDPAYVDRDMWEKIVLNLMSNAFKYTLEGEVRVSLRRSGASIELRVTDTGVGIPERELPHVFERFHRVEGSQGRTHEGTGIGLSLVQELVRLHGGSVRVASRPGAGSTFTVTMPAGAAHLPADRIDATPASSPTTVGAKPYVDEALRWLPHTEQDLPASESIIETVLAAGGDVAATGKPRARVLIADDNADMRDYVTRLLATKYDVEAVADGSAALSAARRRIPDVILADVMMPVVDGFALLRELRGDSQLSAIPMVLLSARAGEEARVEGWTAGADDYLVKPFSARELLARVESHLNLARVRREADAALRESENRFRALVLASSDVVYRMNPDWSEMRYLEGRDFIQNTHAPSRDWLSTYIAVDDQPQVLEAIQRAIAAKSVLQLEHRVRRVDGTLGWTLSRAVPISDSRGEIIEWFGTATDITERKRTQEALQHSLASEKRARAEAQRANRMKDEFLTTLSHELRTPLNAILGWSQILAGPEAPTGDHLQRGLETIERNARAQIHLIEDLLDVSRISEGKIRLEVKPVALADTVEAAMASVRPAAEAKRITIQTLLDRQNDQVTGDPARLQQVAWNLLSNAVKFTPKGGRIQVVLELVQSQVVLSVADNGEGIAPEFLPHVFDRFRQGDQTTTRAFGGLGLGLSIVRHLVELHGGSVRAVSEGRGKGTTFVVELPLRLNRQPEIERIGDEPRLDAWTDPHGAVGAKLDGVTVLYVDDEPDARELAQRVLSNHGARVVTSESAASARASIANDRPDVIVADVGMPDEDGYSLIRAIRALPPDRGGSTPAAAVTALARPEDRRRALLAGFQTHVAKPVDVVELVAVVASLAGRTGR
jgi:signal transduction histidine kinase/PleD family two-component response regulator